MTKRSAQETLASRVSRLAIKRTIWTRNQNGSLDVYSAAQKIVFTVHHDCSISWRYARDQHGAPYLGNETARQAFAEGLVNRFAFETR